MIDNLLKKDYQKSQWALTLNNRPIKNFIIEEGQRLIIGRGDDADVIINNSAVSRHHTAFEQKQGEFYIEDLKSLNGTFVNGQKIGKPTLLSETDTIHIGKFQLSQSSTGTQDASRPSSFATSLDIDDETVFVGQQRQAAAAVGVKQAGKLTVIQGLAAPQSLDITGKTSIKIGKDSTSDIRIGGWLVARSQCFVVRRKDHYYVIPQRSWTSTKVNGDKVKDQDGRTLQSGDVISIGSVRIRFD